MRTVASISRALLTALFVTALLVAACGGRTMDDVYWGDDAWTTGGVSVGGTGGVGVGGSAAGGTPLPASGGTASGGIGGQVVLPPDPEEAFCVMAEYQCGVSEPVCQAGLQPLGLFSGWYGCRAFYELTIRCAARGGEVWCPDGPIEQVTCLCTHEQVSMKVQCQAWECLSMPERVANICWAGVG